MTVIESTSADIGSGVPDLAFQVAGVRPVASAATPLLGLELQIGASGVPDVQAIVLRCQVQIEAPKRRYTPAEQERLFELFGEPADWGRTLTTLLWANVSTHVPGFHQSTCIELQLPCGYDFNIAADKYLWGVRGGEIPLTLLFSGTVFYRGARGMLQVAPIPWNKECSYRLDARRWREVMDAHFPDSAWVMLAGSTFDRLAAHRRVCGATSWNETIESLLERAASTASSPAAQPGIDVQDPKI